MEAQAASDAPSRENEDRGPLTDVELAIMVAYPEDHVCARMAVELQTFRAGQETRAEVRRKVKYEARLMKIIAKLEARAAMFPGGPRGPSLDAAYHLRVAVDLIRMAERNWPDVNGRWHLPTCLGSNGPARCLGCDGAEINSATVQP